MGYLCSDVFFVALAGNVFLVIGSVMFYLYVIDTAANVMVCF